MKGVHIALRTRFVALGEPGYGLIIRVELHQPGEEQGIGEAIGIAIDVHARGLVGPGPTIDLLFSEFSASRHVPLRLRRRDPASHTSHSRSPSQGPNHFEKLPASYPNSP